jgi:glycopeptide antibiotics resistance protein
MLLIDFLFLAQSVNTYLFKSRSLLRKIALVNYSFLLYLPNVLSVTLQPINIETGSHIGFQLENG